MITDDGSEQGAAWPMPKFRFEVYLGTELTKVAFFRKLAEWTSKIQL